VPGDLTETHHIRYGSEIQLGGRKILNSLGSILPNCFPRIQYRLFSDHKESL